MSQTISKLKKFIKESFKRSNVEILNVFEELKIIETSGLWKEKKFWDKSSEREKYMKTSFSTFMKGCLNITDNWYRGIEKILSIENGKELFLEYGRDDMVYYLGCTEQERKAILKEAKISPISKSFYAHKEKLFPRPKVKQKVTPITNGYKEKYEKLKEEFAQYKKKTEKEIDAFKQVLLTMSNKEMAEG